MSGDSPHIKIFHHIADINAEEWNRLSANRPFQSHRWYEYGERVMSDSAPAYLLAYVGQQLVARASFWLIGNEPLPPKINRFLRQALAFLLARFPLLICRSPLAFTQGLVMTEGADSPKIVSSLAAAAHSVARQMRASFILFDYLSKADAQSFSNSLEVMSAPNAGTIMENRWRDFDDYLASGDKKDRQHYKRTLREAEKLGIKISRHSRVEKIDEALNLIRLVEKNHDTQFNPWARSMLENMEMVNGTFVTATINEKLVGCGLLLEDNGTQVTSLLGLAENVPYAYFMLVYESLKVALEHKVRLLRWGSGAYDVKQRLGFSIEDNGAFAFTAVNPIIKKLIRRFF